MPSAAQTQADFDNTIHNVSSSEFAELGIYISSATDTTYTDINLCFNDESQQEYNTGTQDDNEHIVSVSVSKSQIASVIIGDRIKRSTQSDLEFRVDSIINETPYHVYFVAIRDDPIRKGRGNLG